MATRTVPAHYADVRGRVLAHTVASIAYSAQHFAGWSRLSHGGIGTEWEYRWPRIEMAAGCPAEDLAAREAWGAIRTGDLRGLPPFFPGDRTAFTVRNDRGMLRHGWTGPEWLNPPTAPLLPAAFDEVLDSLARGEWHRT